MACRLVTIFMGFLVVAGCANVPPYQFRGPFATALSILPHSTDQRVGSLPHVEMVSLPSKSVEESVAATDAIELDSVVRVDTLTHKELNYSLNLDDSHSHSTDRNRVSMSPWERLSADQVNFYSGDSLLSQCMGSNHNDVNVVSNRLPIPYRPEKLLYPVFSHRQIFL